MKVLKRIINSKKAIYAFVPILVNAIGAFVDIDLTQPAILVLDGAFGLLLVAQGVLDMIYGSQSDGTAG